MTNAAEDILARGAADDIAIECGAQRLTYGDLRARVRRTAGALRELGVGSADRVAIVAPDGIEWVVVFLGAVWAGGVGVGLNPRLDATDLALMLGNCEPRIVLAGADQQDLVRRATAQLSPAPILLGPVESDGFAGCEGLWEHGPEIAAAERADDDPALWIHTSGTTGVPKGVVHPQRTMTNAHLVAEGLLGVAPGDRLYATSKLFFAYAVGNSLFPALTLGATLILDPQWPSPARVQEVVEAHRPTVLFAVPTLYNQMLKAGVAERLAGSGIRHFVSAGETLPLPLRTAWETATKRYPISGYGTSETLCLMLISDDSSGLFRPTPGTTVRDLGAIPADLPSRIWLRAPQIALGYWRDGGMLEHADFRDGWFSPGDMFIGRDDERLEFTGRDDDLVKISGQWVSTQWVEQSLAQACGPAVSQLAAVATTTVDGLNAIAVLAVAAPDRRAEAERELAAAIESLPRRRRPHWVHWLAEMPLTATGKVARRSLRGIHEDSVSQDSASRGDNLTPSRPHEQPSVDPAAPAPNASATHSLADESVTAHVTITVNSEDTDVYFAGYKTLLEVLREDLALTGTKHGCELGECGACAVLLDGVPVLSCLVLALECDGRSVETVEGLATGSTLHPLQEAFADHGGSQCGYCTSGMLLTAKALLDNEPHPDREQVRAALAGNICRCTGYEAILTAVQDAARRLRTADAAVGSSREGEGQ